MKYKKYSYILVLILMLMVGINRTYAAKPDSDDLCYYISPSESETELRVIVKLKYGKDVAMEKDLRLGSSMISIIKYGNVMKDINTPMLNWSAHFTVGSGMSDTMGLHNSGSNNMTTNKTKFEWYYEKINPSWYMYEEGTIGAETDPSCPQNIVIEYNTKWVDEYFGWGTENESLAKAAVRNSTSKVEYAYASNFKDGKQITRDMFFKKFEMDNIIGRDEAIEEYTCKALEADLFGTKSAPTQLRYYIDSALQYVRIIVPILIILLGTVDFAKAVIAGKEDEMKKAQSTFIKRVIAGVAVFFVPVFVDVLMYLANIVWEGTYTSCNLL